MPSRPRITYAFSFPLRFDEHFFALRFSLLFFFLLYVLDAARYYHRTLLRFPLHFSIPSPLALSSLLYSLV